MRIVNYIYYSGRRHSRGQRLIFRSMWVNQFFFIQLPSCFDPSAGEEPWIHFGFSFLMIMIITFLEGVGGGGKGLRWDRSRAFRSLIYFPSLRNTLCACLKQANSSTIRSAFSIVFPITLYDYSSKVSVILNSIITNIRSSLNFWNHLLTLLSKTDAIMV